MLYSNKQLVDLERNVVLYDFSKYEKDTIMPDCYKIIAYNISNKDSVIVEEDENAV